MSETSLKNSLHNLDYELYSDDYSMNQLWQLAANKKKKLTQKSKKMFPTTQKSHVSPFGSNSQGCIYLLKIIAAITSVPIQFPRVGIFGSIFRNHGNKCVKLCFYWSIFNK
jgi:hypothetical protein